MSKRTILDALDRGQPGAVGGRSGRWEGRVSGLFRAAVAMGVRALARGAHAGWRASLEAEAGVMWRLRCHACALSVVVGAAPARQRGGDRRGAALGRRRAGAPPDRPAARPSAGNGPRVAQVRAGARGEPASVRCQVDVHAGSRRAQCGDSGRQRAVRRRRGDHARRPRVGTALRSPANRTMGAGGVDDRRPAVRPATPPAVATSPRGRAPARPHRHPAAHGGCGSSAAAAPTCSPPPSLGA